MNSILGKQNSKLKKLSSKRNINFNMSFYNFVFCIFMSILVALSVVKQDSSRALILSKNSTVWNSHNTVADKRGAAGMYGRGESTIDDMYLDGSLADRISSSKKSIVKGTCYTYSYLDNNIFDADFIIDTSPCIKYISFLCFVLLLIHLYKEVLATYIHKVDGKK